MDSKYFYIVNNAVFAEFSSVPIIFNGIEGFSSLTDSERESHSFFKQVEIFQNQIAEQTYNEVIHETIKEFAVINSIPTLTTTVRNRTIESVREFLKVDLCDKRYDFETAGCNFYGAVIRTDRESQAQLLATSYCLRFGLATRIDFKAANGWMVIDTEQQILAVGTAVTQHVQKCFTTEKMISEEIDAMTDLNQLASLNLIQRIQEIYYAME